jgi:hypothetical protein
MKEAAYIGVTIFFDGTILDKTLFFLVKRGGECWVFWN